MIAFTQKNLAADALPMATGSASRNGPSIDCRGYDGCCFLMNFGAVEAGASHTFRVQGSNDGSTWQNLDGVEWVHDPGFADSMALLDIGHPRFRYLRMAKTGDGANDSTEVVTAFRYRGVNEPVPYAGGGTSPHVFRYHAPEAAS